MFFYCGLSGADFGRPLLKQFDLLWLNNCNSRSLLSLDPSANADFLALPVIRVRFRESFLCGWLKRCGKASFAVFSEVKGYTASCTCDKNYLALNYLIRLDNV